jgi:hypothetical protein
VTSFRPKAAKVRVYRAIALELAYSSKSHILRSEKPSEISEGFVTLEV